MVKRFIVLITIFITAGCGRNPQGVEGTRFPAGGKVVYVVNGLSETLSAISLTDRSVSTNVLGLGRWPNGIAGVEEKARIYVVDSGDNDVMEIETKSGTVMKRIDVGIGKNPWECAVTGRTLWVTSFLTGELAVFDLEAGGAPEYIHVGTTLQAVLVHADAVYVTDTAYRYGTFDRGRVVRVESGTGAVGGEAYVGKHPQDLLVDNAGLLHVLCTGTYTGDDGAVEGEVHIIDPVGMAPIDTLVLGGRPSALCEGEGGVVYAAGYWGGVTAYDATEREVLFDSSSPLFEGDGFMDITYDFSTGLLYIAEFDDDRVVELDPKTGVASSHFGVGDGPVRILLLESR